SRAEIDGVAAAGAFGGRAAGGRTTAGDHRAREFPDPDVRVRDDLLAVAADRALAVDVPAAVGWIVVPEVHALSRRQVPPVGVDDLSALAQVCATWLDGEICRDSADKRQWERWPVDGDRGEVQVMHDSAVGRAHGGAGRQADFEARDGRVREHVFMLELGGDCVVSGYFERRHPYRIAKRARLALG